MLINIHNHLLLTTYAKLVTMKHFNNPDDMLTTCNKIYLSQVSDISIVYTTISSLTLCSIDTDTSTDTTLTRTLIRHRHGNTYNLYVGQGTQIYILYNELYKLTITIDVHKYVLGLGFF